MKKLGINIALLAAVAVALNVAAQDGQDNQPTPPAENQDTQEPVMLPVPVTTDNGESTNGNNGGPESSGQPAADAKPPESFVKEGTTSPRYVAPMKRDTNAPTHLTSSIRNAPTPTDKVVKDGEKGIMMNFRNAPLDMVLSHLSDVAGFIVIPKVDVKSKVTVWSNQPLTKDEAIDLLNKVLAEEGYAVLRDNRTLTIVTQSEAKKRNETPVKMGYEPSTIPKDLQVVTQIIPVRFINAVQLAKDLQPLMPSQTTMTANEGGNALVITDTQQNIHRLAEIIKALDTTVSSLSSVKVFQLRYADAKTVADMVKEVFTSADSGRSGGGGGRGRFQFGGGGGPFGGLFGGGGDNNSGGAGGRPGASKVVATADERSNSLVVSAPDDLMPTIEQLVASVDTNVEDVTEIRVFRLKFADPQETSDLLASLFPDPTSSQNQRGGGGFFRGPFGFGGNNDNTSSQSDRMKKQSKVIAVPDKRTSSVVVTAARDTMEQIGKMIEQLDSDPARKQKVHVFELQNVDPTTAQQTLEDLFSGQSTTGSRSRTTSGQAGTQLNTRAQRQNQNTSGTRNTGSSSFGGNTGTSGTRSFGN